MSIVKINQDGSIKLNNATLKALALKPGDYVNESLTGDSLVIRKHVKPMVFANIAPKYGEMLAKRFGVPVVVATKTETLAIYGDCDIPDTAELNDSVTFEINNKSEYIKDSPTGNIEAFYDVETNDVCGAIVPVIYGDTVYGGFIVFTERNSVFDNHRMLECLRFAAECFANECHANE